MYPPSPKGNTRHKAVSVFHPLTVQPTTPGFFLQTVLPLLIVSRETFFSENRFSVVQSCRIFGKNSEVLFELTVKPRPEVLKNETGLHYRLSRSVHMANKKREKPKHLGRGLASLLGPITSGPSEPNQAPSSSTMVANFPPDKELHSSLKEISTEAIFPNPYQPRTVWDQRELEDLAESIKANGVIQPIIVRPTLPANAGSELQNWRPWQPYLLWCAQQQMSRCLNLRWWRTYTGPTLILSNAQWHTRTI
jgi:hypothetical protein